ncbi:MAG: serine protease [Bacteroidota bacterium]
MEQLLQNIRSTIVQIATSYSKEGTGFYWKQHDLIITNEHIVRDHQEVIIEAQGVERQMVEVLFIDQKNDLAFLLAPPVFRTQASSIQISTLQAKENDTVIAAGHPFGERFQYIQGKLLVIDDYLKHDAVLPPSCTGGPLFDLSGYLLAINAFVQQAGQTYGLSLAAQQIEATVRAFKKGQGKKGSRCLECETIVFESGAKTKHCSNCGHSISMLSMIQAYEAVGVAKTVEDILSKTGHEVKLARRGPSNWEIEEGSAQVRISYHEDSGLIMGDAYLCLLPESQEEAIYQFLLQQNRKSEGLTFSVNPSGNEIILSLLIYDRYLNVDTGVKLFQHLFERADYYDNVLVEDFGAKWK